MPLLFPVIIIAEGAVALSSNKEEEMWTMPVLIRMTMMTRACVKKWPIHLANSPYQPNQELETSLLILQAPLQSPSHSSSGGGNPTHQIQRQIQYPTPQLCLNCRAEANLSQGIPHNQPPQSLLLLGMPSTAGAIGGDDTTVDELAGYFDLMLYLPRPMSENGRTHVHLTG